MSQIATIFAKNIYNLQGLVDLPLLTMMATLTSVMSLAANAEPSVRQSLKMMSENGTAIGFLKQIVDWRKEIFRTLFEKEKSTESSVNQLIYLLTAHLWTSFEVLASDLWIAMVNDHPSRLGQRISKKPDNRQNGKNIPIEILAKYNFNIKSHMGTLLANKFDFDEGISGIRDAYVTILPEHRDKIESIFKIEGLFKLEETRHLIVHRAGIVDAQFNSHMKTSFTIGSALELAPSAASDLASAAVVAGCELMALCDDWITGNDDTRSHNTS